MLLGNIRVMLPADCTFLVEFARQLRRETQKNGTVEIEKELALQLASHLDGMTGVVTLGELSTPPAQEEPL